MNEIIKIKNSDYGKYEELLIRRDNLRKEAHIWHGKYMKEFGQLIVELFQAKIDSIEKKKIIEYYQKMLNKGQTIDAIEMDRVIREAMENYQKQLDSLLDDYNRANAMGKVTEYDLLQIKQIYRRLAKQIHPDINPMTAENPVLMDIWNRITAAYRSNDLEELKSLEVMANAILKQLGIGGLEIEIPNIAERIEALEAEILEIMETEPYAYKYILEDEEAVLKKKAELQAEIKQYEVYNAELEEAIENMMVGGKITWRMS